MLVTKGHSRHSYHSKVAMSQLCLAKCLNGRGNEGSIGRNSMNERETDVENALSHSEDQKGQLLIANLLAQPALAFTKLFTAVYILDRAQLHTNF